MNTLTYKGLKVTTLKQLAEKSSFNKDIVGARFQESKETLTYGMDYFKLKHEELKAFKKENRTADLKGISSLVILTESGVKHLDFLEAFSSIKHEHETKAVKQHTEVLAKPPSIIPKRNQIVEIYDSSVICYDPEEYIIIKMSDYENFTKLEFLKSKIKEANNLLSSINF